MKEWITVEERLPEKMQSVLVYRDGDMGVDFIDDAGGWFWDDPDELPPGNTLDAFTGSAEYAIKGGNAHGEMDQRQRTVAGG